MKRMIPDRHERALEDCQLDMYDKALRDFGCDMEIDTRKRRSADWWARFGTQTLELTKFAIQVFSLTCNASSCERNWSTFEYTKKINKLEQKRLNALVFVMYNMKLRERNMKRRASANIDPILTQHVEEGDEWITEIEDQVLPTNPSWVDSDSLGLEITTVKVVEDAYINLVEPIAPTNKEGSSGRKRGSSDGGNKTFDRRNQKAYATESQRTRKGKSVELNLIDEDEDDEIGRNEPYDVDANLETYDDAFAILEEDDLESFD